MPTRNVVLTDRQADLVATLVDSGRYQNASEVIRDGLRLIERQKTEDELRLKTLREAVEVGVADIEAGRYQDFVTAASLRDFLMKLVDDALTNQSPDADGER